MPYFDIGAVTSILLPNYYMKNICFNMLNPQYTICYLYLTIIII